MTVRLSPQTEAQIEELVASGQFADADAVINEAIQLLAERELARFRQLQALVREGFESGEAVELTPELMDEIEREAEAAYQRGEQPSPHVCP
jgi:putative addiction module CopG family antidote